MKCKAVLTLLLRNIIFLNGFHMFAHQLLRLVPVSGNKAHQPSAFIHLKSGIMFLHNISSVPVISLAAALPHPGHYRS